MSLLDRMFPKVDPAAPPKPIGRGRIAAAEQASAAMRATAAQPTSAAAQPTTAAYPPAGGAYPGPAPGGNGAAAAPAVAASPLPPGGGMAVVPQDLLEQRTALARRLAELQWDLGGLAYEMAIRDHFRPDVLVRKSAELQQVDAELGELERMLRMEQAGAAGTCPNCGALHSRGACSAGSAGTS